MQFCLENQWNFSMQNFSNICENTFRAFMNHNGRKSEFTDYWQSQVPILNLRFQRFFISKEVMYIKYHHAMLG